MADADDKAYQDYLDQHAYEQYLAQHSSTASPEAQQLRESMKTNPEAAETPYGHGEQQGLEHPVLDPTDLAPMVLTGGLSAGSGLVRKGMAGIAESTGLSQIPGRLMSSAVGGKLAPKVGQTLVDEGLMGTRNMMQNQAGKQLGARGQELTSAVARIPGKIDSTGVAGQVSKLGSKFQTPGGVIPDAALPEYSAVQSAVKDIAARGATEPSEALALKRIAADGAYSARDKPLSSIAAKLGQTESNAYGKALESGFGDAFPDEVNAVQSANEKLSALIKGSKALKGQAPSGGLTSLLGDAGIAGAGMATGHPTLGIAGVVAKHAAASPLVKSAAAQATNSLGNAISKTVPPVAAISLEKALNEKVNK